MSYTGVYSPLYSVETEGRGAAILDMDDFQELKKHTGWSGVLGKAQTHKETRGDYPKTEYEVLHGFKTWEKQTGDSPTDISTLGCNYNIERLAYQYAPDDFENFWAAVSQVTEPFEFYHPLTPHGFTGHGADLVKGDWSIVHVLAANGNLAIEKYTVGSKESEILKDDW